MLRALAGKCYRVLVDPRLTRLALLAAGEAIRQRIWPPISRKVMALAEARAVGGSIPLEELERLWDGLERCERALCLADGLDLRQLEIVLRARKVTVLLPGAESPEQDRGIRTMLPADLVIEVGDTGPGLDDRPLREDGCRAKSLPVLRLRADGGGRDLDLAGYSAAGGSPCVAAKPQACAGLKVLLLNDWAFQYGAGTALKRQAASFLLNKWEVVVVAWRAGRDRKRPAIMGSGNVGGWHGVRTLGHLEKGKTYTADKLVAEIKARLPFQPDIVLLGNTHAAGWPVDLPIRLRELGAPVLAYMHDCYWVTGRCAYPGSCNLFRTGCDARCPTPQEYPSLSPEKIGPAWRERSAVFTGQVKVPLIANSRWTLDVARQRYGSDGRAEMVHLGLDHRLFAPMPKSVVRRLLGLPVDKVLIAIGAVEIDNQWKGGPTFHQVYQKLRAREDIGLILFGRGSDRFPSTRSFGLIENERIMPFLFNAADIYVTTANAESFGQTLLEASACGVPVVAFKVGGIPDIVVHEENGFLVDPSSVEDLLTAVERLITDRALREQMGRRGRARVENNFTLGHQGQLWNDCLMRLQNEAASGCSSSSTMSGSVG